MRREALAAIVKSAALMLLAQSATAEAADVKLLYTSAISAILNELGPAFERASGHRLIARSDVAAVVKRQIEAGAEFDVAILLGDFDDLIKQGRIAEGTRAVLGRTGMGVGIRKGAPKPDIGTPEAFRRTLLGARSVAYIREGGSGARFLALLERLGIAEEMKAKLRPVATTADAVAAGDVELVVSGAAPILTTPGLDLVGWLPSELNTYSVFIGGVAAAAKEAEGGKALIRFLTAPAAVGVLKAKGVEPFNSLTAHGLLRITRPRSEPPLGRPEPKTHRSRSAVMTLEKLALASIALALALSGGAQAQAPEKKQVTLGVGGKTSFYYLPLTIAERLGYFKEQGLEVIVNDFRGGAQSLQSLVGGSVDVVTGAYEHTIRMQAKGQDILAVIELGRFPGIAVGVRKSVPYNSPADLKGMKIGVSAPGSSTHFVVMYLMSKGGLKPADASYIGVGISASAVAAMKKGEIDAISNVDPMIVKLEQDGDIRVVADSRTEEGTRAIFGGSNPAAVLYLKRDFMEKNPNTVQALVNAFHKTLKWLEQATPEQIAATVPEDFYLGDKPLYLAAAKANKPVYSLTGLIPAAGMKSAYDMLVAFDTEIRDAKVDLAKTFDDRFVKKAAAGK